MKNQSFKTFPKSFDIKRNKIESSSIYVTKIKNCFGFMRVDQILKVWFLLSPKIIISPK